MTLRKSRVVSLWKRLFLGVPFLVVLCLVVPSSAAAAVGALTQLPGADGCFEPLGGLDGCSTGTALGEASSVAISPDGKNVYVGAADSNAVDVFARNPVTGQVAQLAGAAGCVQETGGIDPCTPGRGLNAAKGVAVSPNGKFVFVASGGNSTPQEAIAVFARDQSTGALAQPAGTAGCVQPTGGADGCALGTPLQDVRELVVSTDNRHLYAAVPSSPAATDVGAVDIFTIDQATGALTQPAGTAGCIEGVGQPDGCAAGRAIREADGIAISPDGRFVYVAASEGHDVNRDGAIDTFSRNSTTGALVQLPGAAGCIDKTGTDESNMPGTCATGKALHDADTLAVSGDGKNVYVAGQGTSGTTPPGAGALSVFARDIAGGALSQLPGTSGCITQDGSDGEDGALGQCTIGRAIFEPSGVTVSPDLRNVYLATSDTPGAVVSFARDPDSGAVTQLSGTEGCVSTGGLDGTAATCSNGRALAGANSVAVSPDGESVYAAVQDVHALTVLERSDLPPACSDGAQTITTDTRSTALTLSCTDPQGSALTRSIVSGPSHGTLTSFDPVAGTAQFTPTRGFVGADSFTFSASDGSDGSAVATFRLTIQPPPALSRLKLKPTSFAAASRGASIAKKRTKRRKTGTSVSYSDTQTARTTFTVLKRTRGIRKGKRCVAAPKHRSRRAKRCTRYVSAGSFKRTDKLGANKFHFTGRVRHRKLKPGSYKLQLQARNGVGKSSAKTKRNFRIVR